jgi:hypothetical protein
MCSNDSDRRFINCRLERKGEGVAVEKIIRLLNQAELLRRLQTKLNIKRRNS